MRPAGCPFCALTRSSFFAYSMQSKSSDQNVAAASYMARCFGVRSMISVLNSADLKLSWREMYLQAHEAVRSEAGCL